LLASAGKLLLKWKELVRQLLAYLVVFVFEMQHNTVIKLLVLLYVYLVPLSTKVQVQSSIWEERFYQCLHTTTSTAEAKSPTELRWDHVG
jgi:cation transporter-like permease